MTRKVSHKTFYTLLAMLILVILSYIVYSYNQPIPNPGHGADTIWISVNGMEKTLQQAINDGNFGGGSSSGVQLTLTASPGNASTLFTHYDCSQLPSSNWRATNVAPFLSLQPQQLSQVRALLIRVQCGEVRAWLAGGSAPPSTTLLADYVCSTVNNDNAIADFVIPATPQVNATSATLPLFYKAQGYDCPSVNFHGILMGYYR